MKKLLIGKFKPKSLKAFVKKKFTSKKNILKIKKFVDVTENLKNEN